MSTALKAAQRAFRVGATPRRVDADAAGFYGFSCKPSPNQLIAYVRHHYTNYDRVRQRHPMSQVDYFEFKNWVNEQIWQALRERAARQAKR